MSTTATPSVHKNEALGSLFHKMAARSRIILLLLMFLTSVAQPMAVQAQAASTTIKISDTFPFSFFNECTGEFVSGVVSVKTTIHETIDANGSYHFGIQDVFNGRAVGETSGMQYVGPQTDHESFHVSSNGALEDTFTLNFRFISLGSADNIQTHLLFHTTITPNGDVTSEITNFTEVCRG